MRSVGKTAADIRTEKSNGISPALIDATRPAARRIAVAIVDAAVLQLEQTVARGSDPYPGAKARWGEREFKLATRVDLDPVVDKLRGADVEIAQLLAAKRGSNHVAAIETGHLSDAQLKDPAMLERGTAFGEAIKQELASELKGRGFEVLHSDVTGTFPEVIFRDPVYVQEYKAKLPLLQRAFSIIGDLF